MVDAASPRAGPGADGRAVALGVVVAWLVARDELAPIDAAERVLLALGEPAPCEVFKDTGKGGYATRIPLDRAWFATDDGLEAGSAGRVSRRVLSAGIGGGYVSPKPDPECLGHGWAGFSKWLLGLLRGALSAEQQPQAALPWCVVLQSDARSRLGWGDAVAMLDAIAAPAAAITEVEVTDWQTLVQYRAQFAGLDHQRRPKWLPAHVAILAGCIAKENSEGRGKGAVERVAKEIGVGRTAVQALLKKSGYTATGKKPASPFDLPSRMAS